jgi:hypothetical protein
MTETGDPGMFGSTQFSMVKTWMKDNLSAETNASFSALKSLDFNTSLSSIWEGGFLNDEAHQSSADSPASQGIMRVKVDWQVENEDGSLTQLGRWYQDAGLVYKDNEGNWVNHLDEGDDIMTGIPGKRGMANSIDAGILQFLHYQQKLKRSNKYNPEDNTYDGMPLDYVAASMHVHPEGHKKTAFLNYMKQGDRNYSNSVMLYSSMLTTNTNTVQFAEGSRSFSRESEDFVSNEIVSHVAADAGQKYMSSKTNSIFEDQTGGASFFSKENNVQRHIIDLLQQRGEGQDVQAQIMIDKLQYGIKLKKDNPGYSDSKIMELIDEKFQVIQIPQEYQDVNQGKTIFQSYDELNEKLIEDGHQPINPFHHGMKI